MNKCCRELKEVNEALRVLYEKQIIEMRVKFGETLQEERVTQGQLRSEIVRLQQALSPNRWNREMNDAWHCELPDLQTAFQALRSAATGKLRTMSDEDILQLAEQCGVTDKDLGLGMTDYGNSSAQIIAFARELLNPSMEWIDARVELPNDGEVVLIYTNEDNVFGSGGRLMREHVATFCKGRIAAEVEQSGLQQFADECGNNRRPYRWKGDGPCAWFGQEVTHWARITNPSSQPAPSSPAGSTRSATS